LDHHQGSGIRKSKKFGGFWDGRNSAFQNISGRDSTQIWMQFKQNLTKIHVLVPDTQIASPWLCDSIPSPHNHVVCVLNYTLTERLGEGKNGGASAGRLAVVSQRPKHTSRVGILLMLLILMTSSMHHRRLQIRHCRHWLC
jgi:hypothetical protein